MRNNELNLLVNRFCDEFESGLQQGTASSVLEAIESAQRLNSEPEFLTKLLPELIALEIVYSRDRNQSARELRSEFPSQVETIEHALGLPSVGATVEAIEGDTVLKSQRVTATTALPKISNVGERFKDLAHLASGGLGDVYVGSDTSVRRSVAIKMLKPTLVTNPEAKQRFINEVQVTGLLEHPGIVPVYDWGITDAGQPYYAMKLIAGSDLKTSIRELHDHWDSVEFGEKTRYLVRRLAGACDAVSFAHSKGVIHRDLKPANILLGDFGEVVVIDWGLARRDQDEPSAQYDDPEEGKAANGGHVIGEAGDRYPTRIGQILGTPEYMSPEQAGGDPNQVGQASDVYSLGAILHDILTGSPPLGCVDRAANARNGVARFRQLVSPGERLATVSPVLNSICERALNAEPNNRYSTAADFASDLENWLTDSPVSAHPDSSLDKVARFLRKHRSWTAFSAVVLVVVALGSILAASIISSQNHDIAASNSRANRSLKRSVAAITDFFQQVEREPAFDDTLETIELRKRLLKDGSSYLYEFLEDNRLNPDLQLEVGKAHVQLSRLYQQLGETQNQSEIATKAVNVLTGLYEEADDNPYIAAEYAVALFNAGQGRARLEFETARSFFERAMTVSKPLQFVAGDQPNEIPPAHASIYFSSKFELAKGIYHTVSRDQGLGIADEALDEVCEFAARFPSVAIVQRRAAQMHNNGGVLHAMHRGPQSAAERYRKAIEFAERSVLLNRHDQESHRQLAGALGNLIIALQDVGDYDNDEVRAMQRQVNAIYAEAAARHPGNKQRQYEHIRAIGNSGSVLGQIDPKEAIPHLDEALSLLKPIFTEELWNSDPDYWLRLATLQGAFLATHAGFHENPDQQLDSLQRYIELEKQLWERSPSQEDVVRRKRRACNDIHTMAWDLTNDGDLEIAFQVFSLLLMTELDAFDDPSNAMILLGSMRAMIDPSAKPTLAQEAWPPDLSIVFARALSHVQRIENERADANESANELATALSVIQQLWIARSK